MAATERRDVGVVIAETRKALDQFEGLLNEFGGVLDELEDETRRQRAEREARAERRRKGWL